MRILPHINGAVKAAGPSEPDNYMDLISGTDNVGKTCDWEDPNGTPEANVQFPTYTVDGRYVITAILGSQTSWTTTSINFDPHVERIVIRGQSDNPDGKWTGFFSWNQRNNANLIEVIAPTIAISNEVWFENGGANLERVEMGCETLRYLGIYNAASFIDCVFPDLTAVTNFGIQLFNNDSMVSHTFEASLSSANWDQWGCANLESITAPVYTTCTGRLRFHTNNLGNASWLFSEAFPNITQITTEVELYNNGLTAAQVDDVIIHLATNNGGGIVSSTGKELDIFTGNTARTSASDSAYNALIADGWNIV